MNANTRRLVELYGDLPVSALAGKPDPIVGDPVEGRAASPGVTAKFPGSLEFPGSQDDPAREFWGPDGIVEFVEPVVRTTDRHLHHFTDYTDRPDPWIALGQYLSEGMAREDAAMREAREWMADTDGAAADYLFDPWDAVMAAQRSDFAELRDLITYDHDFIGEY